MQQGSISSTRVNKLQGVLHYVFFWGGGVLRFVDSCGGDRALLHTVATASGLFDLTRRALRGSGCQPPPQFLDHHGACTRPQKALRGGIRWTPLEPLGRSWRHFHFEPVPTGPSGYRTRNVKPHPSANFQSCFENPFSEIGSDMFSRNFQDEYGIPPRRALRGRRVRSVHRIYDELFAAQVHGSRPPRPG